MSHWLTALIGADALRLALLVCLLAVLVLALPKVVELVRLWRNAKSSDDPLTTRLDNMDVRMDEIEQSLEEHKERMEPVRDESFTMRGQIHKLDDEVADLQKGADTLHDWMKHNSDKLNKILGALGID
jgi:predicted nuclease with TOPRIM domain